MLERLTEARRAIQNAAAHIEKMGTLRNIAALKDLTRAMDLIDAEIRWWQESRRDSYEQNRILS